ncbi:unnamed protein product, partial [Phaeothamnion confervicola]
ACVLASSGPRSASDAVRKGGAVPAAAAAGAAAAVAAAARRFRPRGAAERLAASSRLRQSCRQSCRRHRRPARRGLAAATDGHRRRPGGGRCRALPAAVPRADGDRGRLWASAAAAAPATCIAGRQRQQYPERQGQPGAKKATSGRCCPGAQAEQPVPRSSGARLAGRWQRRRQVQRRRRWRRRRWQVRRQRRVKCRRQQHQRQRGEGGGGIYFGHGSRRRPGSAAPQQRGSLGHVQPRRCFRLHRWGGSDGGRSDNVGQRRPLSRGCSRHRKRQATGAAGS